MIFIFYRFLRIICELIQQIVRSFTLFYRCGSSGIQCPINPSPGMVSWFHESIWFWQIWFWIRFRFCINPTGPLVWWNAERERPFWGLAASICLCVFSWNVWPTDHASTRAGNSVPAWNVGLSFYWLWRVRCDYLVWWYRWNCIQIHLASTIPSQ